ncbi:hypothetical protein CI109_103145 [Kwoniella shandongensis]|uniref:FAD/NAD(P)-binding domain-containing protein n=1 Tax=Kwoniella shandongensis TaxID=1734106 RepID=A0AAJ8LHN6_9TREE
MPAPIPVKDAEPPWPSRNARGYEIPNKPFGSLRPLKVIAIGAGISGISLAHSVETDGEQIDLQIYELGGDYGGTWYWNKYPGCRCDIPSINYQNRFRLAKYFKLHHEVVHAQWLPDTNQWEITVRSNDGAEFTSRCDVFINAGGVLNAWKWPDIKGLHSFQGILCHTARWPDDVDLKGKRVAIVGSGSSGIQLLATVQPECRKVYHWIRTCHQPVLPLTLPGSPTWITSAFAQKFAGPDGKNFLYTEEQKQRFAENPLESLKYRKMIESELNQRFRFLIKGTPEQTAALETRLKGNQRLIDAMIPTKFLVGCRRPTPGNGYLEALNEPNVQVYTEMFQRVTEKGFIDHQGNEVEVDVFVCATGFDTSFRPRFPVINAQGINIQDLWRDYPIDSYLSIAIKDTPNILKKMQKENITKMDISPEAVRDFNEHRDLYLKRTTWSGTCSSWFKPGPDASPVMFPGNRVLIIELLTNPRWEDWRYTYGYAGNRFGYMGNGFTMRELDGRDTTFYYGLLDGKDEQPDYADVQSRYTFNIAAPVSRP